MCYSVNAEILCSGALALMELLSQSFLNGALVMLAWAKCACAYSYFKGRLAKQNRSSVMIQSKRLV